MAEMLTFVQGPIPDLLRYYCQLCHRGQQVGRHNQNVQHWIGQPVRTIDILCALNGCVRALLALAFHRRGAGMGSMSGGGLLRCSDL